MPANTIHLKSRKFQKKKNKLTNLKVQCATRENRKVMGRRKRMRNLRLLLEKRLIVNKRSTREAERNHRHGVP